MTILPDDRGRRGPGYTLLTPANRYASRLPELSGSQVYKLVTPRLAPARFGQYLVIAGEAGLQLDAGEPFEHFFFGLRGEATVTYAAGLTTASLTTGGFAYLGPEDRFTVRAQHGAEFLWIKRRYQPTAGHRAPPADCGRVAEVPATETAVEGLVRRELIDPADPSHDFNMSHMEFSPGVMLPQIEIHDEEHGLFMTGGCGVYRLDRDEHEVAAHDFIYMAPYCPQGFRAGPEGGSYLLYKDVYRDGF
jgi:(S)-ureidoglycine aminohydrolase